MYSFGTALVGPVGESFKLCWGAAPASLADYNVPLDLEAVIQPPHPTPF